MTTLELLRARGHELTTVTTADHTVSGYINQALLADKTVFALVGSSTTTPAHEATVVAIDAIVAVEAAP